MKHLEQNTFEPLRDAVSNGIIWGSKSLFNPSQYTKMLGSLNSTNFFPDQSVTYPKHHSDERILQRESLPSNEQSDSESDIGRLTLVYVVFV